MIWLLVPSFDEIAETLDSAVKAAFRTIFYSINELIYKLIIYLYNVFIKLCSGKLLDNDALNSFFGRVGLILGLIMFMSVAFSFIKFLIDPDSFNDKQNGISGIIKRVIIVIVMFGISGYVFNLFSNVQEAIINGRVISKIILPSTTSINTDDFGGILSSKLFLSFYRVKDVEIPNGDEDERLDIWCANPENIQTYLGTNIATHGDFSIGYDCLNVRGVMKDYSGKGTGKDFIIDFNYIFCALVGIIVAYLLLTYCVSVGIRIVQLAVLQIISPMAIVSYLSPKQDNMFSKWIKIYFSTYIDVFIRIAIINFIVYLSGLVLDSWTDDNSFFWTSVGNPVGSEKFIIGILMIIALLSFAKKAPELIKQLFPQTSSGISFGLGNEGARAFIGAGVGATVGAIGGVAGGKGLVGKATGLLGGIGTGTLRGGKSGFDAKGLGSAISGSASAQSKANLARAQRIASGATFGERVGDSVRGTIGMMSGYDKLNQELSMSDNIKSTLKDEDAVKHIQEVKQSYMNNLKPGEAADVNVLKKFEEAEKSALRQMYHYAYESDSAENDISIDEIKDSNGKTIMNSFTDKFTSNRGIHNQIHTNEKRAGKKLDTYDGKDRNGNAIPGSNGGWKQDNTNLQNKIADKHKNG